ncbi:MAG: hypothetical protein AAB289_17090, partial [Chloroflexota bacterium]
VAVVRLQQHETLGVVPRVLDMQGLQVWFELDAMHQRTYSVQEGPAGSSTSRTARRAARSGLRCRGRSPRGAARRGFRVPGSGFLVLVLGSAQAEP